MQNTPNAYASKGGNVMQSLGDRPVTIICTTDGVEFFRAEETRVVYRRGDGSLWINWLNGHKPVIAHPTVAGAFVAHHASKTVDSRQSPATIARAIGGALLWLVAVGLGATIVTLVLLNWFIGCDASQPSACVFVPWVTTQEIP